MKIVRPKEWWLNMARREGDYEVGAGLRDSAPAIETRHGQNEEEVRVAFGRFVNLMRRKRSWTLERLAEEASLDVGELMSIEDNLHAAEPRTVYKLAEVFEVPRKPLMQLAGLVIANDPSLREQAVRFAARAEPMQKLSKEESAALKSFVATLSQKADGEER